MPTPKFLYKYRSGTTLDLTNLSAGKLWFPSPAKFNDPFDCELRIEMSELSDDAVASVVDGMIAEGACTEAS